MEFCCPQCDGSLAIVHFPSDEQTRAHAGGLTGQEAEGLERRRRFLERFDRAALRDPAELPELDGDALELLWDFVSEDGASYTIVRLGDRVVWKEPAVYEGAERFEQVATILKQRYAERLRDLAPTRASHLYLYGDQLSAPEKVERIRRGLRG